MNPKDFGNLPPLPFALSSAVTPILARPRGAGTGVTWPPTDRHTRTRAHTLIRTLIHAHSAAAVTLHPLGTANSHHECTFRL
jgi:hypothetical protein